MDYDQKNELLFLTEKFWSDPSQSRIWNVVSSQICLVPVSTTVKDRFLKMAQDTTDCQVKIKQMYLLFKFVRIISTKLHQGHLEIASRKEITMVTLHHHLPYPEISENFKAPGGNALSLVLFKWILYIGNLLEIYNKYVNK